VQLDVIVAGIDTLEGQLFVGLDRLVLDIVEGLIGAPVGGTRRRQVKLVDGVRRQVPELQALGGTGRRGRHQQCQSDEDRWAHRKASRMQVADG
jgi:hypothetical protein